MLVNGHGGHSSDTSARERFSDIRARGRVR